MKLKEITESDAVRFNNKKQLSKLKELSPIQCCGGESSGFIVKCGILPDTLTTTSQLENYNTMNVIPASKFLKPSLKKRVKELETKVEFLNQHCLGIVLTASTDIEVHFDEVEKLPEKWCVLKTLDNWKEVGEWFQRNSQAKPNIKDYGSERVYVGNYLHYPAPFPEKYHAHSRIQTGYTEISFETFKRLVLKEDEKHVEFELNKWYKSKKGKALVNYNGSDTGYGFLISGRWSDGVFIRSKDFWQPATDEEVKTALIAEAERRGFKEGVKANLFGSRETTLSGYVKYNDNWLSIPKTSGLIFGNDVIFRSDKGWAEIISEPEIDFSKAGQLVISTDEDKVLILTLPHKRDVHGTFTGIVLSSNGAEDRGEISDDWASEDFTLYHGELTLSN